MKEENKYTASSNIPMDKSLPKFASIKKDGPCNPVPEKADLEWTMVHSREDAIKWHLKWTPWFSPKMIEALVDYGYKAQRIDTKKREEIIIDTIDPQKNNQNKTPSPTLSPGASDEENPEKLRHTNTLEISAISK
jgi:hypothetical protein